MLISLLFLNLTTTYLICCFLSNLFVFFVIFFALIIINSEVLSLGAHFSANNILIISLIELILTYIIFKKKKVKFYFPNIKEELIKYKNAFLLDKHLIPLALVFIFMLICYFILSIVTPPLEPDARVYHFVRIFDYIHQSSFSHFNVDDVRNVIMPINSEIFYSYFFVFLKKDFGFNFLSYFSFIFLILAIVNILKEFKISKRQILFCIFVLSSLGMVNSQICSLQTDITVALFSLTSLYLFILSVKDDKTNNSFLFLSALSYALAIGTKTTAIMNLPCFVLILISYLILFSKSKKNLIKFFSFLALNIVLFSSYNYILNYIHYNNFIAPNTFIQTHSNINGISEIKSNLIVIMANFIGIRLNTVYDERTLGSVFLGIFIFIPSIIYAIYLGIVKTNKTIKFFAICSLTFILNYLLLCTTMVYFPFSIRFFVLYCSLSCFCLIYFYKKRTYKILITYACAMILFCFSLLSTRYNFISFLTADFKNFTQDLYLNKQKNENIKFEYKLKEYIINNFKKEDSIGLLNFEHSYELKKLSFRGYDIKNLTVKEIASDKKIKYDYLVLSDYLIVTDNFVYNPSEKKVSNEACFYVYKSKNSKVPNSIGCLLNENSFLKRGYEYFDKFEAHNNKIYIYKRKQ